MKHKNILILLGLAIIASALLTFADVSTLCGGETSGCVTVANSDYANIFGISTSLIGLIVFSLLFILTILSKKNKHANTLLKYGLIISAIASLFFIYLQIFDIGAICKYCMVSDVSIIIAAIIYFLPEGK